MRLRSIAVIAALAVIAVPGVGLAGGRRHASHQIRSPRWLTGVTLTEYWPVPESWFRGKRVALPGIPGRHRVDWAYSGTGLVMEGDGIALDGRRYHVEEFGSEHWVSAAGKPTRPTRSGNWTHGPPAWRAGGWRNASGAVTFPLEAGGWSNGPAVRYTPLRHVVFGPGPSLPLVYYRSVAVDPRLIPPGSRIFIPAYKRFGGGWFVAHDTGSGIIGRHVDIYRPPPATPDGGNFMQHQRIYVIPPGR